MSVIAVTTEVFLKNRSLTMHLSAG